MASRKTARVLAIASALAIGCGGNGGGTPDSGAPQDGGGGVDLMLPADMPQLSSGTLADPTAMVPDMTCLGANTQPAPGGDVAITMNLTFFSGGTPAKGVDVWFFRDNVIRDTCDAAFCQMGTSSVDDGSLTFTGSASGWYAYRVFPHDGPTSATEVVGSVQYNEPAPAADGMVEGNAVERSTVNLIPALLGGPRDPNDLLIAGRVMDCNDVSVRGAVVRMFEGGELIAEGGGVLDAHYRYFNGDNVPDAEQPYTNVDGLYAAVNIPVPTTADGMIRVEAWGIPPGGTEPVRIGCESIQSFVDPANPVEVSIINIGPVRSDYPTGHPCAGL